MRCSKQNPGAPRPFPDQKHEFWNSIDHLSELELPDADRNLIVTVHYHPLRHPGPALGGANPRGIDSNLDPSEALARERPVKFFRRV